MQRNLFIQTPFLQAPPNIFVPSHSQLRNQSLANSYLYTQGSPTSPILNDRYSSQPRIDSNIHFQSNQPQHSSYFPEQSNIERQKSYFSRPNTYFELRLSKKSQISPQKEPENPIYYKILYLDESVYYGEIKDQMKHGKGTLYTSDNQLIYTGEWRNDKYHGLGILNKGNIRYKGYFEQGFVSGEAVEETKTFKFYGFFKKGKRNGPGILYSKNQVKKGFWKDNILQEAC